MQAIPKQTISATVIGLIMGFAALKFAGYNLL